MSLFDKLIIPLIEPKLKPIDFTSLTGFIGCYTVDPDKPTGDKQFFIVFDDNVRNEYSKDLSIRMSKSLNIKKIYTKRVNNIPYYIYSFYVNPEAKKYYKNIAEITAKDKMKFIKFWSEFDKMSDVITSDSIFRLNYIEKLPLEDYNTLTAQDKRLVK